MNDLKKVISVSLFALVAGGLLSVDVKAGEVAGHGPIPFADFDLDNSGFISEEEFNTVRGQRMATKAAEGKQLKGAATAPGFSDVDTDDDGQISPDELAAAHKAHREERHAMSHKHGAGHMKGGCGAECKCKGGNKHKGMKGKNMPMFSDFDLDADGKITEQEFNEGHAKRTAELAAEGRQMKHAGGAPVFSEIDTNADGAISEEEFAAHQAEHHRHRHQRDQQQ